MTQRAEILDLLSGKKIDTQPAFSGLIHITMEGLENEGVSFHEIHKDPPKMAKAAASTFRLTGMSSAALPLDLCAPAEALGAELSFYEDGEFQFPQVKKALVESSKEIGNLGFDNWGTGRLPIILEAIGLVKGDIGSEAVISGMLPGPYTLLLYLCNPKKLFAEMKKEPETVLDALFYLSSFLSKIGHAFHEAGADFITIHDMGGSPAFIGPAKFEQFALPAEMHLIEQLPAPRVLSVCGNVTKSLDLLNQTGAEALSIDQTVDLQSARAAIKDILLFGNLDPVGTMWQGNPDTIRAAAVSAKEAEVDAIWPGCDLVLQTSIENIRALST